MIQNFDSHLGFRKKKFLALILVPITRKTPFTILDLQKQILFAIIVVFIEN